jgi:hypothetical protein
MDKPSRPSLLTVTKVATFRQYYWEKKALLAFCRQHGLPTSGGKLELEERITDYLTSGTVVAALPRVRVQQYDADGGLTSATPVVYYKNCAKTRAFFVSHLGDGFRFNHYLRAFAKHKQDGRLTYGDLLAGYRASLRQKQPAIAPQFAFNQFQRDYHRAYPTRSIGDCRRAWKQLKQAGVGVRFQDYLAWVDKQNDTALS